MAKIEIHEINLSRSFSRHKVNYLIKDGSNESCLVSRA